MCLEDEKCDAFEYTETGSRGNICLRIQLHNAIVMGYSYNVQHTGSVDQNVFVFNNLYKTVFWTDKVGIKKSWRGKIMPNSNEFNTIGLGHASELTKLDEIHQLQHHGQCCEYLSIRFPERSDDLKPYIFSINQEVKTHVEYFNIGKVIWIIESK